MSKQCISEALIQTEIQAQNGLFEHEQIETGYNSSLHDFYSKNTEAFIINERYFKGISKECSIRGIIIADRYDRTIVE